MKLYEMSMHQAKNQFELLKTKGFQIQPLDEEDLFFRNRLLSFMPEMIKYPSKYLYDLEVGLVLYEHLQIDQEQKDSCPKLSIRQASNDGFWRWLSLQILPDQVYVRWQDHLSEHRFYQNKRRIWLKSLWWYIHLSWQGNLEQTKQVLSLLGIDEIIQLVERVGDGYRVDLYREMMKQLIHHKTLRSSQNDLFRKVMKLNTMRLTHVVPEFYQNGIEGYVKDLYDNFKK